MVMLLVTALAAPLAVEAPPSGRIHRIGVLGTADGLGWQAFRDGLRGLGYVEGKTIVVDWRWVGSDARQLADLAADLVRLQVELIGTDRRQECDPHPPDRHGRRGRSGCIGLGGESGSAWR